MKAVLYIGPQRDEWSLEFFPRKSPGELQIAGKSWVRHAVDLCSLLGAADVYIADFFFRKELPGRLGDGSFWSLRLHCLAAFPCARPDELLTPFREEIPVSDDLLIFWNPVLPDVPDARLVTEHLREVDPVPPVLPDGIYLLRKGKLYACECPLFRLDTLKHYFDLNFRLLKHPGIYNLPGYATVDGCSIGMDVIIMLNCDLEKPVLISDNVCLERGVRLRNGVIIGQDVLIDEKSELDHSIILNHTYVGKNMSLRNKIVDGNRVIDVESETLVELEDRFLTGSTRDHDGGRYAWTEYLVALGLVVVLLPMYLLTALFRKVLTKLAFCRFVYRIYPKCVLVLRGRARLVRYGQFEHEYAFRYADMWPLHQDEERKAMDDIYFFYHRTVGNIVKVAVLSLLKRFFMVQPPDGVPADDAAERES